MLDALNTLYLGVLLAPLGEGVVWGQKVGSGHGCNPHLRRSGVKIIENYIPWLHMRRTAFRDLGSRGLYAFA
jgi:hypothetical protein